jgi:hypothetical protein
MTPFATGQPDRGSKTSVCHHQHKDSGRFAAEIAPVYRVLEQSAFTLKSGVRHCEAAGDPARWRRHQFVEKPTQPLVGVSPELVENRDHGIAAGRAGIVARNSSDYGADNCNFISSDLGFSAQQRRALDDSFNRCENTTDRLLVVVGRTGRFGVDPPNNSTMVIT